MLQAGNGWEGEEWNVPCRIHCGDVDTESCQTELQLELWRPNRSRISSSPPSSPLTLPAKILEGRPTGSPITAFWEQLFTEKLWVHNPCCLTQPDALREVRGVTKQNPILSERPILSCGTPSHPPSHCL